MAGSSFLLVKRLAGAPVDLNVTAVFRGKSGDDRADSGSNGRNLLHSAEIFWIFTDRQLAPEAEVTGSNPVRFAIWANVLHT